MAAVRVGHCSVAAGFCPPHRDQSQWGASMDTLGQHPVPIFRTGEAGVDYCACVVWRAFPTANADVETWDTGSCRIQWRDAGLGIPPTLSGNCDFRG